MTIDLRKLRNVVAVASAESISSAAHRLAITQPALTRSIADVERELGVQLFQRLPRGMRVTEVGRAFVEHARRVLDDVDDLISSIQDQRDLRVGRLRLGIAPAAYQRFVTRPIGALVRENPGLRLEVITGSAETLAPRIVSGDLDMLIGSAALLEKWPELESTRLTDLHYAFMVRKGHPVLSEPPVTEAALLRYPVVIPATIEAVHTDLAELYRQHGLPPMRPHYVADDLEWLTTFVASSDAVSPLLSLTNSFGRLGKQFELLHGVVTLPTQSVAYAVAAGREIPPAVTLAEGHLQAALGP